MPTTITKTIGVGKDYASINAWVAGAASTYPSGLVAADVIWKGVLYKEGSGTNNEWVITATTTSYTLTCDATRYYLLEAAPGQSFTDNASKLTNALRYNNANGVSIAVSIAYVWLFNIDASARLIVRGIQIKNSTSQVSVGLGRAFFENCILFANGPSLIFGTGASATNSLLYMSASGSIVNANSYSNNYLRNCMLIGSGGATNAFTLGNYSSGSIIKNCAIFGFATGIVNVAARIDTTNSTYNATDLASFGWTGTGNIVSKTFANQFQSITGGSEDFRVKAGADLINAGTRDQTYTNDLDIVGSARSTTTPTIGAWEFATITYTYARPASDVTTQWTPSSGTLHYALINETTPNDTNYIYATAAGQTDEVGLQAMSTPVAGTSVLVNYRVQGIVGSGSVTVSLYSGATLVKADTARTTDGTYAMTVTSAEWGAVSVDWSNMRLRFVSA
jgi:hypothetical protein